MKQKVVTNPGLASLDQAFAGTPVTRPEPEPTPAPAPAQAERPAAAELPATSSAPTAEAPNVEAQIAQARAEAREEARREMQRAYQGIQRVVAQKDQQLARLEGIATQQSQQLSELAGMSEMVQDLYGKTVSPEEAAQARLKIQNAQLTRQLAAAQQAQVQTQTPFVADPIFEDSDGKRKEVLEFWYPGEAINVADERIDWALDIVDTNPTAAQARFKKSVVKMLKADASKEAQATASQQVEQANQRLRDSGVDTTDGTLPTGKPTGALHPALGTNPKDWKPRDLFAMAYKDHPNGDRQKAAKQGR